MFEIFHSFVNYAWQRVKTIHVDDLRDCYNIPLPGKTAFVGFPLANGYDGVVLVYEQNQFGDWEKSVGSLYL